MDAHTITLRQLIGLGVICALLVVLSAHFLLVVRSPIGYVLFAFAALEAVFLVVGFNKFKALHPTRASQLPPDPFGLAPEKPSQDAENTKRIIEWGTYKDPSVG